MKYLKLLLLSLIIISIPVFFCSAQTDFGKPDIFEEPGNLIITPNAYKIVIGFDDRSSTMLTAQYYSWRWGQTYDEEGEKYETGYFKYVGENQFEIPDCGGNLYIAETSSDFDWLKCYEIRDSSSDKHIDDGFCYSSNHNIRSAFASTKVRMENLQNNIRYCIITNILDWLTALEHEGLVWKWANHKSNWWIDPVDSWDNHLYYWPSYSYEIRMRAIASITIREESSAGVNEKTNDFIARLKNISSYWK